MDLGIPKGPGTSISWTLRKDYVPFYELINTPRLSLDRQGGPQCMQEWAPHIWSAS